VKRGGRQQVISWDEDEVEKRYLAERADGEAPDKLYEKRWAMSVLELVMARLRQEFSESERQEIFDCLKQSG